MRKSRLLREKIHLKFEGRCAYCGREISISEMQVDHYYPQCKARFYLRRFKIDVHAETNLMPTCRRCNHYKRARTPNQFRELMITLHERLQGIYILKVAVDFGMAYIKPFDGMFYFEKTVRETAQKIQPVE